MLYANRKTREQQHEQHHLAKAYRVIQTLSSLLVLSVEGALLCSALLSVCM